MTTDYTISVATPNDEEAINKMLEASFSSLLSSKYDEILLSEIMPNLTRINTELLKSGTYYLAKNKNGNIVGAGGWSFEKPGTKDIIPGLGHVRHFATHPDWIHKNIGTTIYHRCIKTARENNIKKLECFSTLSAEHFYKSLGFHEIRNFMLEMGDGLSMPAILMENEI